MKKFQILVADDLGTEGIAILEQTGDVTLKTGMTEDELRETLPAFEALVVRSATKVTARSLELANKLAVIGRAGIGIDNIDLPAATERGIVVMNTPDAGAVTTGELAIALLVSLARKIPAADAALKAGRWDKSKFTGVELRNKILGVLGLGNIGRVVAERGNGLGMEVIAFDPYVTQEKAPPGVRMVEIDELFESLDFLTIHVPLMDKTIGLVNRARIAQMKPGSFLIHAARGGIVEDEAVADAIESGHLAGAALDVFEHEPLAVDHRLRSLDNVVLTPHIGASTKEAKRNVALDMANQVALCLERGIALNGVNVPRITPSEAATIGPFLDLAHNLGDFLGHVVGGNLQSVRITLQGGLPQGAARPLTVAALSGILQSRCETPVTPVNAQRIAEQREIRIHTERSSMKRDFMNLVRVEAVFDEVRHFVTGTVLGHRHGRMVEFDEYLIDAIPEGPMLVTFHRDIPGVVGHIGTILGEAQHNISRMQLGASDSDGPAMGIWNLDASLRDETITQVRELEAMVRAHRVG